MRHKKILYAHARESLRVRPGVGLRVAKTVLHGIAVVPRQTKTAMALSPWSHLAVKICGSKDKRDLLLLPRKRPGRQGMAWHGMEAMRWRTEELGEHLQPRKDVLVHAHVAPCDVDLHLLA